MALDATAGGVSSDSYITVADADTYHDTNLNVTDWTGATTADKERALKMATRLFDERIDWVGLKANSTQALRWPRSSVVDPDGYSVDSSIIPSAIANATAEFAKRLLSSDTTGNDDTKGIRYLQADKIKLSFDRSDKADVLPDIVSEMLRGWGIINKRYGFGTVRLTRT